METTIIQKRKGGKPKETFMVAGTITVNPRGFGFVTPNNGEQIKDDVFIPKPFIHGAVDGDSVQVAVDAAMQSKKGPEGAVIAIVERGKSTIPAVILAPKGHGYAAYSSALGEQKAVFVTSDEPLEIGERLLLHVEDWGEKKTPVKCTVNEKLGHISDPATDIPSALSEFQIPHAFPREVINEAKAYGHTVTEKDLKGRLDLRNEEIFTIDPETAKDFDDALSIRKRKDGGIHLGVHIADVSHYVRDGTRLDKEAKLRCNSTYFPGNCIPMLPHELSDNLCSLRPDVDRLTISVLMDFDAGGNLLSHDVQRSVIHSKRRFSYEEALEVLEGRLNSPHEASLHLMVKLCQLLKKKRAERGSVDLALPEAVILVDKKGAPTGVKHVEYDITHQLVEEFMLKANEVIASILVNRGDKAVFRIHEEPLEETMNEFFALARLLGFDVAHNPSVEDIQKLFLQVKHTEYAQRIAIAYIRSMKMAVYSTENVGHYGLSLEHYTHFTSPIRRYSDLVVHRILFEKLNPDDIEEITDRCSEKERNSFKAEQSVLEMKKLRMLLNQFEEDPFHIYEGFVSKIKPHGIYFELSDFAYSGYIHISNLGDDYYEYDDVRSLLYGTSNGHEIALGDKLPVRLVALDLIYGKTEWECGQEMAPKRKKKKKKKK